MAKTDAGFSTSIPKDNSYLPKEFATMLFAQWLLNSSGRRPWSKAESKLRRIIPRFGRTSSEIEPGLWAVVTEKRYTFRTTLYLWVASEITHFKVSGGLLIDREWIPRELLLLLLEANQSAQAGAFQLCEHRHQRAVILAGTVDTRQSQTEFTVEFGEELITRMQSMVQKLYAMGLVIGNDTTDESTLLSRPK